jgi:hypothetical protein
MSMIFFFFFLSHFSNSRSIEDHVLVAQTSIDYPELSSVKGTVRGSVIISGTLLQKVEENKTKITYVGMVLKLLLFVFLGQIDLGGLVPAIVVNLITRGQPLCIAKIRDVCAELK